MESKISDSQSFDGYIEKLESEYQEKEEKISGYTREIGQHIVTALGSDWNSHFQQENPDNQKLLLNNDIVVALS